MVQINGLLSSFLCLIAALGREVRTMPITDVTFQADIETLISPRSPEDLRDIQMKVHKLTNVCWLSTTCAESPNSICPENVKSDVRIWNAFRLQSQWERI